MFTISRLTESLSKFTDSNRDVHGRLLNSAMPTVFDEKVDCDENPEEGLTEVR